MIFCAVLVRGQAHFCSNSPPIGIITAWSIHNTYAHMAACCDQFIISEWRSNCRVDIAELQYGCSGIDSDQFGSDDRVCSHAIEAFCCWRCLKWDDTRVRSSWPWMALSICVWSAHWRPCARSPPPPPSCTPEGHRHINGNNLTVLRCCERCMPSGGTVRYGTAAMASCRDVLIRGKAVANWAFE